MQDAHVEPIQSLSPPGKRRARRSTAVTVGAPLALLVVVVGAGFAGRLGAVATGDAAGRPGIAAAADVGPDRTAAPGRSTEAANRSAAAVRFPETALGLRVHPVDEVVASFQSGALESGAVAVSGWLTIRPVVAACLLEMATGMRPAALCARETILVASPEPLLDVRGTQDTTRLRPAGPHLHPVALPGVSLRQLGGRQYNGLTTALMPVPVVLVGHVGDARLPECRPTGRHCGERFALERIVWVDGETTASRAQIATVPASAKLSTTADRSERIGRSVSGARAVLNELLVASDALDLVDPAADAALEGATTAPVWYVRFLRAPAGTRADGRHEVWWAVLDDASGAVIATGALRARTGS
jgi:hypothetical protein